MEKSGYGRDGIYRNVSCYPEKPALIDADSGETLTFSQLRSTVIKLSHAFLNLGVDKNDRVLIFAPNSIRFPLCFFAVTAIGAIATTANPVYTVNELSKQLRDANPKLIVTVPELFDKVRDFNIPLIFLASKRNQQQFDLKSTPKILSFYDLVDLAGNVTEFPAVSRSVKQTDTAVLLYSSGTTGVSKGVIIDTCEFHCSIFDGDHGSRTCWGYAPGSFMRFAYVPCVWIGCYRMRAAAEGKCFGVNGKV
ncbi:hypothetical protein V6N13_058842 [Hibiscus sabdariffa]